MAGSKKARVRNLERQLGTTGTDPFIPARQPYPPSPSPTPLMKSTSSTSRGQRRRMALIFAALAISQLLLLAGRYLSQTTHQTIISNVAVVVDVLISLWSVITLLRLRSRRLDDID